MRPGTRQPMTRERGTRVSIWNILHGSVGRQRCSGSFVRQVTAYGRAAEFDIPPSDRDRDALHTKEAIVNV